MTQLLAFHNNAKIKTKFIKRVRAHAKADKIVKGQYWQGGKGCAVGCTIHSGDHLAYEKELGIPVMLARLEDRIFEGLPNDLAVKWPLRFLEAAKTGADLSGVGDRFLAWLVRDVARFAQNEKSRKAIIAVADLCDRKIAGQTVTTEEWLAARRAAADAYAAAAAYAADAYAAYAAYAAAAAADAYAAAYAAAAYAAAAYAAADAAAAYAAVRRKAEGNHYVLMSDKLIELMESAP